jgi:hypothetical protein
LKSLFLIAGALFSSVLFAQTNAPQGKVTSEDAVALIRLLEQDPLAAEARSVRSKLIEWATETKDVTITVCDVLGPVPGTDVPYGPELLAQAMFGNGAFQLEHPESKGDEVNAQLAGITSMLRTYAKILQSNPNTRIPQYDAWLSDLAAGKLAERVTPAIQEKCVDSPAKA